MKNYKTIIAAVVAGAALTAVTSQASFTAITPGSFTAIPGGGDFSTAGLTLASGTSFLSSPYSFGPSANDTGTLRTDVYLAGNGAPLGGLIFVYTITIGAGDVNGLTVTGFGGTVDVNNVSGTSIDALTANYNNFGGINFAWAAQVNPAVLKVVVDTSATSWGVANGNIQDNFAGNAPTLAPVPEPSTVVAGALMLLPFGIGAIRSLRKDRTA